MARIALTKIGDAPHPRDGWSLAASAPANDGSLLFLFVEDSGRDAIGETYESGMGTFPRPRMQEAKRFRLIRQWGRDLRIHELPELDVTFPKVDVFPDGRILIVGPRCAWRGEGDYDLNGVVFDPVTSRCQRILLGDGIEDVFVDDHGHIWVSYFDEGIFGNFGWLRPGPEPIGSAGVACFERNGRKIWELPHTDAGLMADCYAMNVSGTSAAIYFYTDFPLCRISSEFELQFWKTGLRGCRTFAILDRSVLFSAQYEEPSDTVHLATLGDDRLDNPVPFTLTLPGGAVLPKGQLIGRGSRMYFFDAAAAYCVDLAQM